MAARRGGRARPVASRGVARGVSRAGVRVLGALAVVWAVVTVTFLAVRAVPGDPVLAILGGPGSNASEAAVAQARADFGLDLPLPIQYLRFLGQIAVGDFGTSYELRRPVATIIGEQLPATLTLAFVSLALAWVLALLLAWASVRGGRFAWAIASGLETVGAVLPHFWIATVLIALFAVGLRLPVAVSGPGLGGLVLPAITLALPLAGFLGQVMRDRLTDALEQPFVVAARARGIRPTRLFFAHLLRHAAVPAVATTGWAFGSLVSGAVVVETIFARPGLGRTLLDAVMARDVPLVCGALIVVAIVYVLVTLATEAVERLVDPRLRIDARLPLAPAGAP